MTSRGKVTVVAIAPDSLNGIRWENIVEQLVAKGRLEPSRLVYTHTSSFYELTRRPRSVRFRHPCLKLARRTPEAPPPVKKVTMRVSLPLTRHKL